MSDGDRGETKKRITRIPGRALTREQRIEWAKQRTAETAEARARERERHAAESAARLAALGPAGAERRASDLRRDQSIGAMGPDKTPSEWLAAQLAIREHVIEAARRGRKVTYGEIAVVAHETTGLKLGSFMFNRMCMDINRRSDGCLISSIIVRSDTGEPGDGFLPYARTQGFDGPLTSLQRGVFERFTQ